MKSANLLQSVERIVTFLGAEGEVLVEMNRCRLDLDAYVNEVLLYFNEPWYKKDNFEYKIMRSRVSPSTMIYVAWMVLYSEGKTEDKKNDTIVRVSKIKGRKRALLKIGYFPDADGYSVTVTPNKTYEGLYRYYHPIRKSDIER